MHRSRLAGSPLPLLLLGALLTACGGGESGSPSVAEPTRLLDPCGGADHPCTLAGVTPEAKARADELEILLSERIESVDDLDEAAAWLGEQRDVASVATGEEALRFRVLGGRGRWIFVRTAGSVVTLGAPAPPRPRSSAGVRATSVRPTARPILQGTTKGQIKKALLLSPFRWQWELEGLDDGIADIAEALRARDYEDRVTILAERLDPTDPSRTTAEIGLSAFTSWGDYDYVHLLTHGGRACNPRGFCMTAVLTPWTEDLVASARAGAEAAGNRKLAELLDRVGVETAKVQIEVPEERIPTLGPGQESRQDVPLTERDRPESERTVRTMTGPFILLTSQFFRDTYDGGIDDAVIVISACSSGVEGDLLRAVQGDNTAVVGWRSTMSLPAAAAAGTLIAQTLVEVDEELEDDSGLTVEQAMQRIRDRIDQLAQDPPDFRACADPRDAETRARCDLASRAQVLGVVNDMPADPATGASLVVLGEESIRAREIVYLVDEEGRELEDGSSLSLAGAAGDGKVDSVDLTIRADGLALDEDPRDVDLRVLVDDQEKDVEDELEREIADGVWELDYRLPLGRDATPGERVDLEIVGDLPGGGDSRWLYEDLRLGVCRSKLQGDIEGTMAGGDSKTFERGRVANFAKLFVGGSQPTRLQMETGRRRVYRFGLAVPLDAPPSAGATYRIEDSGITGDLAREIGGGFNPREGRNDSWHTGSVTVRIDQVEWADVPERTRRKGWACGTVEADLVAMASPPPGSPTPVLTPYTVRLDFWAEITERPGMPQLPR